MPTPVTVQAPPSKSASHRMIMAASLATGTSVIRNVLGSVDLDRTMSVLRGAGAVIEAREEAKRENGALAVSITGVGGVPRGGTPEAPVPCDMHESGTSCRLLTAILAAGEGVFRITGAPRLCERPMKGLIDALLPLGARFTFEGRPEHAPFLLHASGLGAPGNEAQPARVDASRSSQYLSGLLLAAPLSRSGLVVEPTGERVVSWPYARLTLEVLERFGLDFDVFLRAPDGGWQKADWREEMAEVLPGSVRIRVSPGAYRAGDYTVEGDWSNASYFLAAGALGPAPVTVTGLNPDSLQGDRTIAAILESMGALMEAGPDWVRAAPPETGRLRGIDVDMSQCPDLVPTVAALAATADRPTRIRNVGHLRIKECDRLSAPARELATLGCRIEEKPESLVIIPPDILRAPEGPLKTYGDHRMAMSLSILERRGLPVTLDDPGCVSKSFPGFFEAWDKVRSC